MVCMFCMLCGIMQVLSCSAAADADAACAHVVSLRRARLQEAREVKMRAGVTGRLTEPPVRPQPIVENNAEQTTLGHLLCGLLAP